MPADACPVCGASHVEDLGPIADHEQGRALSLSACQACGVRFVDPPLDDDALASYYPDRFYGNLEEEELGGRAQKLFLARRVARLKRWGLRAGTLLDVGCGDGGFLRAAQRRGFTVVGTEPSAAGRARAARRGLEVFPSPDALGPRHFDVVTLWHVLEHVREAEGLLTALVERLAPGGAMVVAVPNAASLEARLFKGAWFHQDAPRHQLQLTPRALTRLLERVGLHVDKRSSFSIEYDPFGLLQSAWNRLAPQAHNSLYKVLKTRTPVSDLPREAQRVTRLALATLPGATVSAIALSAALAPLEATGTITVLARRA